MTTLRLPYFRSGAKILWLWNRFQRDCAEAWRRPPNNGRPSGARDGCGERLILFDREKLNLYSFPDSLLKSRAEKIAIAIEDLERFAETMRTLPVPPDALADMPVYRMTGGFSENLAAVIEDVDADIRAAEAAPKDIGKPKSEKNIWDGPK